MLFCHLESLIDEFGWGSLTNESPYGPYCGHFIPSDTAGVVDVIRNYGVGRSRLILDGGLS